MSKSLWRQAMAVLLILALTCTSVSMVFADTAKTVLKITKQPKSVTVSNGTTAKVTIKANGDGLTYKWYYKNKDKSKYTLSKNFKSTTYSIKMNKALAGRKVYCVVKDKYGKTVKSNVATLHRGTTLKVTKQPKSVAAYKGKNAKVSISAQGAGLTYKWYYKNKSAKKYTLAKNVKGKTYSVEMTKARDGRKVYCVIKDKYGSKIQTKIVTLSMKNPLKITKQPVNADVKEGDTAKVTVSASGDGLTYKWYYKDKGAEKFSLTKTFKGKNYSVKMNTKRDGRQIYCLIQDKYGSKLKTTTVTLSRYVPVKITEQPKSAIAKAGETINISLKAEGSDLKYEWYYKNRGNASFKKTSSFTSNVYTVEMSPERYGRQIYCKITDRQGKVEKSNVVTLNMAGIVPRDSSDTEDCKACIDKTDGMTFEDRTVYIQEDKLSSLPVTFETVFQIKEKDFDGANLVKLDTRADYMETVLFSSDDTYEPCVTYSITEDGHPKLASRPTKWFRKTHNFVFDDVNVFSSKPVHLAITFDPNDSKVKCYIDGILKQTISSIPTEAKKSFLTTFNYAVGGDLYSGNLNHFRGKLYSLSIWSDIRSAKEIVNDFAYGVSATDKSLMASYDFMKCENCMLVDFSSKRNNLQPEKLWNAKEDIAPVGDFDYSFAVIGDTQELSEDYPEGLDKLYQWIVDNKSTHKIKYMLGLGDITQKSYSYEWDYVREQIYRLNGHVPYLLSRGNHDWDTVYDGVVTEGFSTTFNDGVYNQQVTDVMTEGRMENAYRTINICGIDYLFLALDFGPNAKMLEWAGSVVDAHPNHRVVIITHGYMYHDGTTLDSGDLYPASTHPLRCRKSEQAVSPSLDGDDIWEQFASKYENVQLILSGHDPTPHVVYRQDKGVNGNTVTQMLIDPQHIDGFYNPTGMIAMFYFSDNGNTLTVRYYSVLKELYGTEQSQFTIDLSK